MTNLTLNLIRPYDIKGEYIRYGNKSDGGYILNKDYINNLEVLYSYGIADEISFEKDFLQNNPNCKAHLYDHTINIFPEINGNVFKHKEGLNYKKDKDTDNFLNHISINNDQDKNIILKMDAEGAELDFFNFTDLSLFNKVTQMIVEFHTAGDNFLKFLNAITRINHYFYCAHIHQNNCGGHYSLDLIECTFINKKSVTYVPEIKVCNYPIQGLDYPNCENNPVLGINYK
jgi:protease II